MTYTTYTFKGDLLMIVSVEEMKKYLRVDFDDDDALIEDLLNASEKLCLDTSRMSLDELNDLNTIKIAIMYAVAYMYEHKESIDYHTLTISLRSLLQVDRKSVF